MEMHLLLALCSLLLPHQALGSRIARRRSDTAAENLENKTHWFWRKSETPLTNALEWLKSDDTPNRVIDDIFEGTAVRLHLKVHREKEIELYSISDDGDARPAKCMTLSVNVAHHSMHVGWIGSEDPSNPCLFSMKTQMAWIEEIYKWGQINGFTRFGCTDMARGTCKYKDVDRDGNKTTRKFPEHWIKGGEMMPEWYWQGRVFQFTPMSLVKYGMPFYTKTTGVFPYAILKAPKGPERTAAAQEFCATSKRAKDLGAVQLNQLLLEVDPKVVPSFQDAMRMMDKGAGAKDTDTLASLLMDKSVWTRERNNLDECHNLGKVSGFLSSWPCKTDQDNEAACQEHRELSLWIKSMVNLGYDRSMIEVENDELACDFYDTSWKLAMHSRWGHYVRPFLKAWDYLKGLR